MNKKINLWTVDYINTNTVCGLRYVTAKNLLEWLGNRSDEFHLNFNKTWKIVHKEFDFQEMIERYKEGYKFFPVSVENEIIKAIEEM